MFEEQPDRYKNHSGRIRGLLPATAGIGIFAAIGATAFVLLKTSGSPAPRPHQEQIIAHITLPPPPPPPPVKPPPDVAKKEPQKARENPSSQKATVPKAAPKAPSPPAAVTTSNTGPGPGSLAAGNGGGGDCLGTNCGSGDGGGGGDDEAYFENMLRSQVDAAIRRDERLRFAKYHAQVGAEIDSTGHVTHANFQQFDGPPDIEAELQRLLQNISTNLTLPGGKLHRTIILRISEHA